MSGDCDQQDRGKRKQDVADSWRPLREFSLGNTPPGKEPNHPARSQSKEQGQKQISFKPFPDREEIKCHTDDEERYRKVNDYRVLRVFRDEGGF